MLPLVDILHRGVVLSLVGLSVYGIGMGVMVHRDTLQRGKGAFMARREAVAQLDKAEEQKEISLAEAAQAAIKEKTL